MDYSGYTVHIVAIPDTDDPYGSEDQPEVFAVVDTSQGSPVLSQIKFEAPPGVSAMKVWHGIDLDQLVDALPKIGTALKPQPPGEPQPVPGPEPVAKQPAKSTPATKKATAKSTPVAKKTAVTKKTSRPRGAYRLAPENVLEEFEQKYNSNTAEMAQALDVPAHTIYSWVRRARKVQARQAELNQLPVRDPDSEKDENQ